MGARQDEVGNGAHGTVDIEHEQVAARKRAARVRLDVAQVDPAGLEQARDLGEITLLCVPDRT